MRTPSLLLARAIATGFGSGCAPFSPGTFGTAAAILVWILTANFFPDSLRALACCLLAVTLLAAAVAVPAVLAHSSSKDPSSVVIDEWAGMFVTLAVCPVDSGVALFLAFVLFRAFDIVKPAPVRWMESLPGAVGVMADDLVAGVMAAIALAALQSLQLPWLA